jgi:hypothetical protein
MSEKHDLLILPNQGDSSIVVSEPRSILAARGRRDASSLSVRKKDPLCLASVKLNGKWGFIDKAGKFVIAPLYGYVGDFWEGRVSFTFDPFSRGFNSKEPLKNAALRETVTGIFPRRHRIGAFSSVGQFI